MRFRAHSYMAFVFTPEPPIYDWLNELDAWLARSPDFFVDRPVVLNLAAATLSGSAIAHLIASLEERKIRVLGERHDLFRLLRRSSSAPVARERLQILLAHERNARNEPELLGILRGEILAVIGKHVALDPDKVQIKMDRGKTVSTLEVDIEIPNRLGAVAGAA